MCVTSDLVDNKMQSTESLYQWQQYLKDFETTFFPTLDNEALGNGGHTCIPIGDFHKNLGAPATAPISSTEILHVTWSLVLRRYIGHETPCFGAVEEESPGETCFRIQGVPISLQESVHDYAIRLRVSNRESWAQRHPPWRDLMLAKLIPENGLFDTAVVQSTNGLESLTTLTRRLEQEIRSKVGSDTGCNL